MNHRVAIVVAASFLTQVGAPAPISAKGHSHRHQTETNSSKVRLLPGLGVVHRPVSTKNAEAQKFFDQGLAFLYGFDHEAAQRSFEQAAKLDANLAMAWWGVALCLGPNINIPVDPAREKAAYEAVQRALSLQNNASQAERGYINALAYRYSNDPKADLRQLDIAYRDAMSRLVKSYPDDLDAATLYAESMMDLHPWQLWLHDGRPNEGTEEIVAVLESVLKRDPNHLGANHYYIHATEASPQPERALPSTFRLEKLAPAAGHLTHMPSHVYDRVGDYAAAVRSNQLAVAADQKFFQTWGTGVAAVMYHVHNLHFLAYAACKNGNFNEAKKAADAVASIATPHVHEMPEMEGFFSGFISTPLLVLIAFERWDDILKLPAPDASLALPAAVWRFARTLALASQRNLRAAEQEYSLWQQAISKVDGEKLINETNKSSAVLKIHGDLMSAALAQARGDDKQHIDSLTRAVANEDAMNYAEPPAFYPPVRPQLGCALLRLKRFPDAERVFRTALEKTPRLVSAMTGLRDSLEAQNRTYEAGLIDQQLANVMASSQSPADRKK
jgi:tetratricopeptide (TPR) repeat protein